MDKRYVDIDDVLDLFGIEDEDLYATGTIEDALYDGTLKVYERQCAERLRLMLYKPEQSEYEYALQIIAEMFDPPCSYTNKGHDCAELLLTHAEGFCEECDTITPDECWRKYFEILRRMEAKK